MTFYTILASIPLLKAYILASQSHVFLHSDCKHNKTYFDIQKYFWNARFGNNELDIPSGPKTTTVMQAIKLHVAKLGSVNTCERRKFAYHIKSFKIRMTGFYIKSLDEMGEPIQHNVFSLETSHMTPVDVALMTCTCDIKNLASTFDVRYKKEVFDFCCCSATSLIQTFKI